MRIYPIDDIPEILKEYDYGAYTVGNKDDIPYYILVRDNFIIYKDTSRSLLNHRMGVIMELLRDDIKRSTILAKEASKDSVVVNYYLLKNLYSDQYSIIRKHHTDKEHTSVRICRYPEDARALFAHYTGIYLKNEILHPATLDEEDYKKVVSVSNKDNYVPSPEVEQLVDEIIKNSNLELIKKQIDAALDNRDEAVFKELCLKYNQLGGMVNVAN